ncbi:hypothetical protein ACUOA5_03550, partial [Escherichia coli]
KLHNTARQIPHRRRLQAWLLLLGHISFPLYLLHELVIVSGFIFDAENAWVSISLAAFASIFIAYIYARFIDYPLYRALKRQIAKIS